MTNESLQKGEKSSGTLAIVSTSPHIRSNASTRRIMLDVIIALLPAFGVSIYYFGLRALAVTLVTVVSCVLFEFISRKIMKREQTVGDLSAVVTGLLLAFNLPSTLPLWMAVFGAAVAIVAVKQMFGGIGQNFVNPAIAARIVLVLSFATPMTSFAAPFAADAQASVTPLKLLSNHDYSAMPSLLDLFLGNHAGSLGETCVAALLLGGIYLIIRRVITPVTPLIFIFTTTIITFLLLNFDFYATIQSVLSGGLILGAVFMATDYTTSPVSVKGQAVFAFGCGILTALIRLYGNMPEGASFAIIVMNILVPHIESFTAPKPFGSRKIENRE